MVCVDIVKLLLHHVLYLVWQNVCGGPILIQNSFNHSINLKYYNMKQSFNNFFYYQKYEQYEHVSGNVSGNSTGLLISWGEIILHNASR